MGDTIRDELRSEAKRLYIDASYSSRGHFEDASDHAKWAFILGVPLAILGGISAAAASAAYFLTENYLVAGALALASAVLTSVHGFMQPDRRAEAHGVKAARYKVIRDDAIFFLKIDLNTMMSEDALRLELKTLRERYNDLALMQPHRISPAAYERAKRGIAAGEANYEDDPLWNQLEV